ncbi:MAG: homoserine O-acetyltransferase [Synergistes sp.]|nr:homoserine O-acetyltransferase [Synergistes sp.]
MKEEISSVTLYNIDLPSGVHFNKLTQVYAKYGEVEGCGENVILVCHALTGSHRLTGQKRQGEPDPWWIPMVGDGKAIDTRKFCAICFNNLCSPYGSTSPISINPSDGTMWRMKFPILSPRDVAFAQHCALNALGIKKIYAVVGGSLGGMIASEYAISFPQATPRCVMIAAPDRLYPQAIAFNTVQRHTIMADAEWNDGNYDGIGPAKGLAAARMLAMITYRSEQSFSKRYMRDMARGKADDWQGQFKIESYLDHHGQEILSRFDANCYLYLTRMMDLQDVGEGRGGIDNAWKQYSGNNFLGIGVSSDILFPNWQIEEAVRSADKNGVFASYEEIESDNGHDSFLIDFDQLDDCLRPFIRNH